MCVCVECTRTRTFEPPYRGDTLTGRGLLCNYCLQLFSTDTSIHGSHDPSMETREDSPGGQWAGFWVYNLNCSQLTHPADLRARRERARKRRARAVHVIFQNSKFQINSDVSPLYALMQQLYPDSTTVVVLNDSTKFSTPLYLYILNLVCRVLSTVPLFINEG